MCHSLCNGNLSVSDILFLLDWVNRKVLEVCQVIRNWETEVGLLEACGVEEWMDLCETLEEAQQVLYLPLPQIPAQWEGEMQHLLVVMWGGYTRVVKYLFYSGIHSRLLPQFSGGCRSRGYGRKPIGIHVRIQSLDWDCGHLFLLSHCAHKNWEKSSPFREKWHFAYNNKIPFRNTISSSDLIFYIFPFCCLFSLLSSALQAVFFTERLPVFGQFHIYAGKPQRPVVWMRHI